MRNRLRLRWAFWVALAACGVPWAAGKPVVDAPMGVELLKNGGLEEAGPASPPADKKIYWNREKRGGGYYQWPPRFVFYDRLKSGPLAIDRDVSMNGVASMRLTPKLFGDNGFLFSQNVIRPAREGDVFRLRIYVRHSGPLPAYRSLGVRFRLKNNKLKTVTVQPARNFSADGVWKRIELVATAPADTKRIEQAYFKISNTSTLSRCWWDAMSLIKLRRGSPKSGAAGK